MARYSDKSEKKHSRGGRGFATGHDEHIGKSDRAGMPKEPIMSDYPASHTFGGGDLDDTMARIDEETAEGVSKIRKHLSNQH